MLSVGRRSEWLLEGNDYVELGPLHSPDSDERHRSEYCVFRQLRNTKWEATFCSKHFWASCLNKTLFQMFISKKKRNYIVGWFCPYMLREREGEKQKFLSEIFGRERPVDRLVEPPPRGFCPSPWDRLQIIQWLRFLTRPGVVPAAPPVGDGTCRVDTG